MRSWLRSPALKRGLDLAVGLGGLVATAPLLVGTSLAIAATMGRPVLFSQQRPGRGGKPFTMYKFRTMRAERADDPADIAARDAARLTRLGAWLRATSIDELPELWNVVRGDMSIVGPRPLLMRYLSRYTPEQARRHEVKPGITGWAQINGRNAIGWEQKFELDVWYVDHWSVGLDLEILLKTLRAVVRREGISHGTVATMPEFLGTEPSLGPSAVSGAASGSAPSTS